MVKHLQGICEKEGVEAEDSALHVVALKADGALRDALSIFDQLVAFAGKNLTYDAVAAHLHVLDQQTYFDVVDATQSGEIAPALLVLDEIIVRGFDPHHFITGLGAHLRNLLVARDPSTVALMEVTDDLKAQFLKQSAAVDIRFLIRALDLVNEADIRYKASNHQRLLVELTLMQMASHEEAQKKKPELNPIVSNAWKERAAAKPAVAMAEVPTTKKRKAVPETRKAEQSVEEEVSETPALELAPQSPPATAELARSTRKEKIKLGTPDTLQSMEPVVVNAAAEKIRTSPVDEPAIQAAWKAYAEMIKAADQLNLYSTLCATNIGLDDRHVLIRVLNKLQEEQLRDALLNISQFIADQVENDELVIEIKVVATEKSEISSEFMTDRERYDGMVKKNPRVEELRKRLDLDLNG
jgi:DNA polymerase-3 subunit gamma/tau